MYNTYCIVLCIVLCIIFTYHFKTIQPKSSCIIHNTQYNTYYVLIRIMYCLSLLGPVQTFSHFFSKVARAERKAKFRRKLRAAPAGLSIVQYCFMRFRLLFGIASHRVRRVRSGVKGQPCYSTMGCRCGGRVGAAGVRAVRGSQRLRVPLYTVYAYMPIR